MGRLGPSRRRLLIGALVLGLPVPAPPPGWGRQRAAIGRRTVLLGQVLPGQGARGARLGSQVDRTSPALGADEQARRRALGQVLPGG